MAARDDATLLEAWRAGDNEAGNDLFRRHFDSVCRFFKNKVEDPIDDLVQDVFLGCLKGRDTFRGEASFRTYLFRIARNRLYDHFRRGYREPIDFTVRSVADLGAAPTELIARKQEEQLLLRALRAIPLDQQILLELFYWEDLSGAELATVLELNPNTVRSKLHRARQALEAALAEGAGSLALLESTLTRLEDWAAALRG